MRLKIRRNITNPQPLIGRAIDRRKRRDPRDVLGIPLAMGGQSLRGRNVIPILQGQ